MDITEDQAGYIVEIVRRYDGNDAPSSGDARWQVYVESIRR